MRLFQAEVRAAIRDGENCTVCTLLTGADRSRMRSFLREHGSDPLVLEPVYAAWGFCAWHTWALAVQEDRERGAVLTMALLAGDLLRHLASLVGTSEEVPLPAPPEPSTGCTMCRATTTGESCWMSRLAGETSEILERPHLCAPHLAHLAHVQQAPPCGWRRWFTRARHTPDLESPSHALPILEALFDPYRALARSVGARELAPHFATMGALAPFAAGDRPDRVEEATCALCRAELTAVGNAGAALLAEYSTALQAFESLIGDRRLCFGHRWLLADVEREAASGGMGTPLERGDTPDQGTARPAPECILCGACREAAKAWMRRIDSSRFSEAMLCLPHWAAVERVFAASGREVDRRTVRQAQRMRTASIREALTQYLRYFSVSTRDPAAPPPGPAPWEQAVTFLVGEYPQGQCCGSNAKQSEFC